VPRVYCDKTAEARIMQFYSNVAQCRTSLPAKFDYEIRRGPLDRGADLCGVVSDFAMLYFGNGARESLGNNQSLIESHIWAFDCNKS